MFPCNYVSPVNKEKYDDTCQGSSTSETLRNDFKLKQMQTWQRHLPARQYEKLTLKCRGTRSIFPKTCHGSMGIHALCKRVTKRADLMKIISNYSLLSRHVSRTLSDARWGGPMYCFVCCLQHEILHPNTGAWNTVILHFCCFKKGCSLQTHLDSRINIMVAGFRFITRRSVFR